MQLQPTLEYKATGNRIEGYGSVFDNVDLGGDVVRAGAFTQTLKQKMPAMLWQHSSEQPIGVWNEARQDNRGLFLKGEFAQTQQGQEARALAGMNALGGMSIGFQLQDFDFDDDGNRIIKAVDLWEVSLVTFPMNPEAAITAVKSFSPKLFERSLREAGHSRTSAKYLVGSLREAGPDDEAAEVQKLLDSLNERIAVDILAGSMR